MSKAAQRKNNVMAIGRHHALRGVNRADNPYYAGRMRKLWFEGWDQGFILRHKQRREGKRRRRTADTALLKRFWKGWYGFLGLFGVA